MTKSQNKYEILFDFFLYLTQFSLIKYEDGFGLKDHQRANLNDIEDDRFETAEQIFERMSVYIDDYIDEYLRNVWVDELGFSYDDIPNTLEGWLDHKEELKEYQYEINWIDMICNHYNEINLENCSYEIINA